MTFIEMDSDNQKSHAEVDTQNFRRMHHTLVLLLIHNSQ